EMAGEFVHRHIGIDDAARAAMLDVVGQPDLESLLATAMPPEIVTEQPQLPAALDETTVLAELRALAARNTVRTSMIGQGYHDTVTPSVIQRNVLENPAWYTAYTPYQPEISQGRLEALLNFETMVIDLTGTAVAGASVLDEAAGAAVAGASSLDERTAAAERLRLGRRAARGAGGRCLVGADTRAATPAVLRTRAVPVGIELETVDVAGDPPDLDGVFGVLLSYPAAS